MISLSPFKRKLRKQSKGFVTIHPLSSLVSPYLSSEEFKADLIHLAGNNEGPSRSPITYRFLNVLGQTTRLPNRLTWSWTTATRLLIFAKLTSLLATSTSASFPKSSTSTRRSFIIVRRLTAGLGKTPVTSFTATCISVR